MSNPLQPSMKPLIILYSKKLKPDEVKELHKHYNNVIEINAYTDTKKLIEFKPDDTVILVDMNEQNARDWMSSNTKYLAPNNNVVWVRSSGQHLRTTGKYARDEDKEFYDLITYDCKKIKTDCKDKMEF